MHHFGRHIPAHVPVAIALRDGVVIRRRVRFGSTEEVVADLSAFAVRGEIGQIAGRDEVAVRVVPVAIGTEHRTRNGVDS